LLLATNCKSNKNAVSSSPNLGKKNKEAAFSSMLINASTEKVLGNYSDAQVLFNSCIDLDSKCAVCYYELSEIHKKKREYKEAIEKAKKAIELSPENEWYKENLAVLYKDTRNYNESEKLYQKLSVMRPKSSEYLFSLAETLLYQNKLKEAVDVYKKLEDLIGGSEELSIHIHRLYVEIGDDENAIKVMMDLIDKFPAQVGNYGVLAEYYENKGEPEKALELYNRILEVDPENGEVHLSLYDYYRFHSNKDKSFEELKMAFAHPKVDVDTKVRILLDFISNSKRYEEVKEQSYELAEILTKTHPDLPQVYAVNGDLYINDGKELEALEMYKNALKYDDTKFEIWSQVVFLEYDQKEYDSLVVDTEKAMELFPSQSLFYFYNGLGNIQLKKYNAAIESLATGKEYVIDNNELLADFYQYKANAHYELKEFEKAFEDYDEAVRLKPNNSYLLNNFAYYLSVQKQQLEKAATMAKKANELNPNNANFLDTYGWVLFQMGNFSEAEVWIQKALDNGGDKSGTVLEHYGDVMFKLNKVTDALNYWEKASQTGEGSEMLLRKIKEKEYFE